MHETRPAARLCDWRVSFGQPLAPTPPKSSWSLTPTQGCSLSSIARSNTTRCTSTLARPPAHSSLAGSASQNGKAWSCFEQQLSLPPRDAAHVDRCPCCNDSLVMIRILAELHVCDIQCRARCLGSAHPTLDEDSCLSCLSVIYATLLSPTNSDQSGQCAAKRQSMAQETCAWQPSGCGAASSTDICDLLICIWGQTSSLLGTQ